MRTLIRIGVCAIALLFSQVANSHCEVPCGIYHDDARFTLLAEDVETLSKAMNEINRLAAAPADHNQLTRWIMTKERHADHFRDTLVQYFLTQRIKPVDGAGPDRDRYLQLVELGHRMLRAVMTCRQQTDPATAKKLGDLLARFQSVYTGKHSH